MLTHKSNNKTNLDRESIDNIHLSANALAHSFGSKRKIFSDISFDLHSGDMLGISGANGAGKSTIVKILCGILTPYSGTVSLSINGQIIQHADFRLHYGLVAPYLTLYEEFSPNELFRLIQQIRGIVFDANYAYSLLQMFSIAHRQHDIIKTFSSGMKQRIKFVVATLHRPAVLFFDEPSTNLDAKGREAVYELSRQHCEKGGIVILATNETQELSLCNSQISIG